MMGGKKASNSARTPRKIKRSSRSEKKVIIISSEGITTEPQYFQAVNKLEEFKNINIITDPNPPVGAKKPNSKMNTDPHSVVQRCIQFRDSRQIEPDFAFAVVDTDKWDERGNNNESTLDKAINVSNKNNIILLITNLKFETWLIWHHDKIPSPFPHSSDNLDKFCSKNGLVKDKKIQRNLNVENYKMAIKHAERCGVPNPGEKGGNPSSAIPHFFYTLDNIR